jgi:hypothetical protein
LQAKQFTLDVAANGRIVDASDLDALLKQVGQSAFRQDPRYGWVKDQEMISDVVATLWFFWDAISSMDANGVRPGQGWNSLLSVPTPMVSRKARQVAYSLDRLEQTSDGLVAVIGSRYSLSGMPAPSSWPIPYSGRFRVSGTFGFLGAYRFQDLQGSGVDRFNVDKGIWEGTSQQFWYKVQAAVPIPFARAGAGNPIIFVDQTVKIQRIDTSSFKGR